MVNRDYRSIKFTIVKSTQSKIQIKLQRINKLSWKFDCSQYSFVQLQLKQVTLMLIR